MRILHYLTARGRDPFQDWLDALDDAKARTAILRRIDRMSADNFGDRRFLRDGVWELRIDVGPGYRVYYANEGKAIVLLLCGGSKKKQGADVTRAVDYSVDYARRLG